MLLEPDAIAQFLDSRMLLARASTLAHAVFLFLLNQPLNLPIKQGASSKSLLSASSEASIEAIS